MIHRLGVEGVHDVQCRVGEVLGGRGAVGEEVGEVRVVEPMPGEGVVVPGEVGSQREEFFGGLKGEGLLGQDDSGAGIGGQ